MVKEGKSRVWYEIVSFIVTDAWTQRQKQGRLAVVFLCICAPPLWLIPEYLWLNALKIKNCLSEASFFNLAESHEYYGLKAITGAAFSWLRSFGRAKEWTGAWGRAPFKNNVFQTEVLFTLLAKRYEQRSVMITSNLPFSKWEKIFKDPMMTAAAVDRIVHHSVILELNIASYRMNTAKNRKLQEVSWLYTRIVSGILIVANKGKYLTFYTTAATYASCVFGAILLNFISLIIFWRNGVMIYLHGFDSCPIWTCL